MERDCLIFPITTRESNSEIEELYKPTTLNFLTIGILLFSFLKKRNFTLSCKSIFNLFDNFSEIIISLFLI